MNLDVPKVYAASKLEQKTTEAPSSITIVTDDEIKKYGYRTLADVMQSVQGFNVSYDRNYAFLGARGTSLGDFNSRVLLLVDGHRINENLTDGAFIDTAFILDIDLVDRVEIIRGPGSVLYGNNAFFGVINVITRQSRQLNGLETSFDYGAFDTYKGRVTFGKQFTNGVNLLLSGTIYDSAGAERLFYKEFDTPAQNNGIAQNMDGDSYRSFFGSLGYTDFTFEGAFNRRNKVNPTAQFDLTTFNDPRLRTVDERGYAALKFAHSFPDVVDVTAQVYYDHYTHDMLLTNLHFNGGVRYDQYGDFDPAFDPRLALIYNPCKESTFKAIYGTAFRAPNFTELSDPRFQNIRPEKITGFELVYEQEIGQHLRSSLSGFYNQMDHLIVFNSGSFTNFDARSKGMELALEGSWAGGIRGRASYSFQDTRNDTVAWQMPDSPNHLLKFNLSLPLVRDKLFAGVELQYTSDRRTLHNTTDSSGQPITVQGGIAGAYGIVNLTLFSQKLIKNLEMSAGVYNLLDRRYEDPASHFHVQDVIEQDGRTFRLKLAYRF